MTSPYLTRQRDRWTRPNARLFVRPDWRRFVPQDQDEHPFAFYENKYRPDQPRVPAGDPAGGRWMGSGGGSGEATGNYAASDEAAVSAGDPEDRVADAGTFLGQQVIHPSNGGGKNCYYRFSYGIVAWRMSSAYMACPPTLPWPAATHSPIIR